MNKEEKEEAQEHLRDVTDSENGSICCDAKVIMGICAKCKERTEPYESGDKEELH